MKEEYAKQEASQLQVLSKEQIKMLCQETDNIRDTFLVFLLWQTGLHVEEALSLFKKDVVVDFLRKHHHINLKDRGKHLNGGMLKTKERILYISKEIVNLYDDYFYEREVGFDEPNHPFLLIKWNGDEEGEPMTLSDVQNVFRKLAEKTGIFVSSETLRYTHGAVFYRSCGDILVTHERMGHEDINETLHLYGNLTDEDIPKDYF